MKICVECRRELDEKSFYKDRNGYPIEFCKECAAKGIDFDNPHNTPALFIRLDVPIYDLEWCHCNNEISSIKHLSRYLAKMKLRGYRYWRYEDTDEVNARSKQFEETLKEIKENLTQELNQITWEKISND